MRRTAIGAAVLVVVVIAGVAALRLFTGGPDARTSFDRLSPDEVLVRMQRAVAQRGSYHVAVSAKNMVLPRWGGVDGGTVDVNRDAPAANASLERTGDGRYTMLLVGGQTYFERSTCPTWTRVPGGGVEALAPFLLADLTDAQPLHPIGAVGNPAGIEAQSAQLGRVAVELDPATFLPLRLETHPGDANGDGGSTWEFSRWGEDVRVAAPDGGVPDGGPGGNPC